MLKVSLNKLSKFKNRISKNKHFVHGLPFLIFMGLAVFVIKECASVRYVFQRSSSLTSEELEALGLKKEHKSLEKVYEEYQTVDIDNWENKRIPKPWEETPQA